MGYPPQCAKVLNGVSFLLALLAFGAIGTATQAADLTWDNGAATGFWNTTDANFTGLWTNGNTAVFGGPAASTITINTAGITATGVTFNVNNDVIAGDAVNNLTLTSPTTVTVGSGLTATINAPLAGTSGVRVEGSGTLNLGGISTVTGGGDGSLGLIVGATTSNNTVNLASGGTMGTISANRRSLYIGSSNATAGSAATDGNIVNISTPGSSGSPSFNASGNGGRVTIGYASSDNELNVSNGAYVAQTNGGGTNTWDIGVLAGADNNKMTITGTGSVQSTQVVFQSNHYPNVGTNGSSNSITVSAGGYFRTSRIGVGVGGGDNNILTVTGANSLVWGSAGSNSFIDVGVASGATGNRILVEAGGRLDFGGAVTTRRWAVGLVAGADNNYITITGSTSNANMVHTGIPLAIGGVATGAGVMTDGGNLNHLDVFAGATLDMNNLDASNPNIPTGSMAVVLLGTNSAFNLGNGSGVSTAHVGGTANFADGVYLKNSDGRLNFNSGRLVAGVNGALVSGLGRVDLLGTAYLSTTQSLSTISNQITGVGDFHKEGSGTLALTNTSLLTPNNYTGDTYVDAGVLRLDASFLDDLSSVYLYSIGSAKMNLNFTGSDTIGALYLDDVLQAPGTYGRTGSAATNQSFALDAYFNNFPLNTFGFGILNVAGDVELVPEPSALAMAALGLFGLGLVVWRRKRIMS